MKKITVTLDAQLVAWASTYAARHKQSLSQLVNELLNSKMRAYNAAMQRYLSKLPARLNADGNCYPTRDQLHDHERLA